MLNYLMILNLLLIFIILILLIINILRNKEGENEVITDEHFLDIKKQFIERLKEYNSFLSEAEIEKRFNDVIKLLMLF